MHSVERRGLSLATSTGSVISIGMSYCPDCSPVIGMWPKFVKCFVSSSRRTSSTNTCSMRWTEQSPSSSAPSTRTSSVVARSRSETSWGWIVSWWNPFSGYRTTRCSSTRWSLSCWRTWTMSRWSHSSRSVARLRSMCRSCWTRSTSRLISTTSKSAMR